MKEAVVVFSAPFLRKAYADFLRRQGFDVSECADVGSAAGAVAGKVLVCEHSSEVDAGELVGEAACAVVGAAPERAQDVAALKEAGAFDVFIGTLAPGQIVEAVNTYLDGVEGTPRANKVLSRDALSSFVAALMERRAVYAPVDGRDGHRFEKVEDPSSVRITYTSTVLPVKKVFAPVIETLLKFDRAGGTAEAEQPEVEPKVILGVHPCDMQGVLRLDWAFTERSPESNYVNRRKDTLFIGVTCTPDEYCFCQNLGTWNTREGYDAFMVDLGDRWLVEILTDDGMRLLDGLSMLSDADEEALRKARVVRRDLSSPPLPVTFHPATTDALMEMSEDDKTWVDVANRCFSCGTCTLVCPTCYCFDVEDEVDITLSAGERVRKWDSCQLQSFAKVATGENFREEREGRVRHRLYRKYLFLPERYGDVFCVGCGRCGRYCTADIHTYDIVAKLAERHSATLTDVVGARE